MSVRFTQTKVNDDERLTGCGGTMWFEGERGKGHIRFEAITKGEAAAAVAEVKEMNRKGELLEWMWRMDSVISTKEAKVAWGKGAANLLGKLKKEGRVLGDDRGHWVTVAVKYPEWMKTEWMKAHWGEIAASLTPAPVVSARNGVPRPSNHSQSPRKTR